MLNSRLRYPETIALVCVVLLPTVVAHAGFPIDPPLNAHEVGHWDGYSGSYCDLTSDGQYVYVPNYAFADGQTARIHIVDISDPANPFLADTFFLPSPSDVASPQDVKAVDGLLFVALDHDANDSVAIIDIRDPLNATLVTTVNIVGFEQIHNLFYDNGFLYLPGVGQKVGIVDLTALDPDNPPLSRITSLKWLLEEVGTSGLHDVTVVGGRLYVAAMNSGLQIYDVSDVANTIPAFLGSVGGTNTHSMWPTQDGRFVVTGEERTSGGIQVFEIIEDGRSLTLELRDSFTYQTHMVHNQAIVGNRLYNSWYEKGLQVFDIDPIDGTLTLVATFDTSSSGIGNWGVFPFLGDEKILVSDETEGLYIVDITVDPPLPAPSPHNILKNRYISIDPRGAEQTNPSSIYIRVMVESSLVDGLIGSGPWWAAQPDSNCVSVVTTTKPAVAPDWTDCDTAHLTGCPIIPTTRYAIAAESASGLSADALFDTQAKPGDKWFGDVVGSFTGPTGSPPNAWTAPNGTVNADDFLAAIKTLLNALAFNATHLSVTDVHPVLNGTQMNLLVNMNDVLIIIGGFQGKTYGEFASPDPDDEIPDLTECP